MSIRFPETNDGRLNSPQLPTRLLLPALTKLANRGLVQLLWVHTASCYDRDAAQGLLGRNGGQTAGNDCYLRFTDNPSGTNLATALEMVWRDNGTARASVTAAAPGRDKRFLIFFVATPTYVYLGTCEPGASPIYTAVANTTFYGYNIANLWSAIGGGIVGSSGQVNPAAGTAFEELVILEGVFPETATGVLDATLLANIVSGAQDLDTLQAQLLQTPNAPVRKCRYRMRHAGELADAWGGTALAPSNEDAASLAMFTTAGQLRPAGAGRPKMTHHTAGQLLFATTGVLSTATTKLPIEGGTIHDTTIRKVQCRLAKEDGTDHVAWFDVATSGSAMTTWPDTVRDAVPAYSGFLTRRFRFLNGSSVQVGDEAPGHGLTMTAIVCMGDQQSQSQIMHPWEEHVDGASGLGTGAIGLPSGSRMVEQRVKDTLVYERVLGSGDGNQRGPGRPARQLVAECNALFPGVPVFLSLCGEVGSNYSEFLAPNASASPPRTGTGVHLGRRQRLRDWRGIALAQEFRFFMNHTAEPNLTQEQVRDIIAEIVALSEAVLGTPMRFILCESADATVGSDLANAHKDGLRLLHKTNAAKFWLAPSHAWIQSDAAIASGGFAGVGGHGERNDLGAGTLGALMAFAMLSLANAVPDRPQMLKGAKRVGSTIELNYGDPNAA